MSKESRIAARLAAKLKQKNSLWDGANWRDIVEYGSIDNPDDLPPSMTRARWLKVQAHLAENLAQIEREFPGDAAESGGA